MVPRVAWSDCSLDDVADLGFAEGLKTGHLDRPNGSRSDGDIEPHYQDRPGDIHAPV